MAFVNLCSHFCHHSLHPFDLCLDLVMTNNSLCLHLSHLCVHIVHFLVHLRHLLPHLNLAVLDLLVYCTDIALKLFMLFSQLFTLYIDLFFCKRNDTVYFAAPVSLVVSVIQWSHQNHENILFLFLRCESE